MYFTGEHHPPPFAGCHSSNFVPVDTSSPLPFSHPSSTASPSGLHPSSYLPSPSSFESDLNSRPNPYPFGSGSARSSSSSDARLVVGIRPPPFPQDDIDVPLTFRPGLHREDSGSSGGDELNGFFSTFAFDGPASPRPSFSHPSAPSPSLPSSSSSSNLPLPSPLLLQSFNIPRRPSDWNSGNWDSLNPFAAESLLANATKGGEDGQGISTKPTVAFTLTHSGEESRTPQACQACRARKSKCDGQASCIRCENKGIKCIYVTRSPRVRGKQARRSCSSALPLKSCFTTELLVRQPILATSIPIPKSERGIGRSRRKTSDGSGRGSVDWEDEERDSKTGRRRGSMGGSRAAEAEGCETVVEEPARRRRRPSADPYPSSSLCVSVPHGSSLSTPPSHHHSQSYQSSFTYPNSHHDQHFQPLHPIQHQPFVVVAPPPQTYQPSFERTTHTPNFDYSPFTIPAPPLPRDSALLPLELQPHHLSNQPSPLLLQHPDAFAGLSTHPSSSKYHEEPPQAFAFHQPHTRGQSFPSVWAPSSNSHLGLSPRPVLVAGPSPTTLGEGTPTQQAAWGQRHWDEFPRCD